MKYQGGLGGEVDEDIGVDAENQNTDHGDDQGEFQGYGHRYGLFNA